MLWSACFTLRAGLELFKQFTVVVESWAGRELSPGAGPLVLSVVLLLSGRAGKPVFLLRCRHVSMPCVLVCLPSTLWAPSYPACPPWPRRYLHLAWVFSRGECNDTAIEMRYRHQIFSRHISGIPSFCACDTGIRNWCFSSIYCLGAVPKQLEALESILAFVSTNIGIFGVDADADKNADAVWGLCWCIFFSPG